MYQKKWGSAYILFIIGSAFSLQTLILLPVFILALWEHLKKEHGIRINSTTLVVVSSTLALIGFFILLPDNLQDHLHKFSSYPYVSSNLCNLWSMLGKNWSDFSGNFIIIPYGIWVILMGIVILGLFLYFSHKWQNEPIRPILSGFLLVIATYVLQLGVTTNFFILVLGMAFILLLFAPTKTFYKIYLCLTSLHFLNLVYNAFYYDPKQYYSHVSPVILLSFGLVMVFGYMLYRFYQGVPFIYPPQENNFWNTNSLKETKISAAPSIDTKCSYTHKDLLCMSLLTLLFGCLVFNHLGNRYAPETALPQTTDSITLDFDESTPIQALSFFYSLPNCRINEVNLTIKTLENNQPSCQPIIHEAKLESEFAWNDFSLDESIKQLSITSEQGQLPINELIILGANQQVILPSNAKDYPELFDEQEMFPKNQTYETETMFDEVYHGRTAYEFIHHMTTYENTHPPLGKIIISIGIRIFGMNPYGWRFMSAVFGTLMVPLIYLFAKKLFQRTLFASLTTMLYVFDFMPINLSRIATIDIFVAFFIVLSYYFMYHYYTLARNGASLKSSLLPLGLCGFSMGLAIATKWTGIYAGGGLGILFFMSMLRRYEMSLTTPSRSSLTTDTTPFSSYFIKTCGFCIITFIVIPCIIYVLSYIPFVPETECPHLWNKAIENSKLMLSYHSATIFDHPYSSRWYEWLIIKRPLLDSLQTLSDSQNTSRVTCMGNPIIWWTGLLALITLLYDWLKHDDSKAGFLCIGYSAQLLPWLFIIRTTFIYHYFASSLFLIMSLGYFLQKHIAKKHKVFVIIFFLTVITVFITFYPAITGLPSNRQWRWDTLFIH